MKKKWSGGFTLIELLIVIAIIGILAALLMANFVGVRQRARDAQRKSDLRQIQSALELYRADVGSYPDTSTFSSCGSGASLANGTTIYMTTIPCDPLSGTSYAYSSASSTTYVLIACLENSSDSQKDSTNVSPCDGTTNFSFTLQNP
ncbi:MAG: type II secretion system protein [Candidatus Levyibacteriota bacterium]